MPRLVSCFNVLKYMILFDFLSVGFSAGQWPVEGVVEYSAMAAVEVLLEQQFGVLGGPL
ncbi:hypothetical protein D3C87_2048670 [compost metagenome]